MLVAFNGIHDGNQAGTKATRTIKIMFVVRTGVSDMSGGVGI